MYAALEDASALHEKGRKMSIAQLKNEYAKLIKECEDLLGT